MRLPRFGGAKTIFGFDDARTAVGVFAGTSFLLAAGLGRDCDSGCRGGFRLLRIDGKLMSPAAGERKDAVQITRVEQIAGFEPPLSRHPDSDDDVVERIH